MCLEDAVWRFSLNTSFFSVVLSKIYGNSSTSGTASTLLLMCVNIIQILKQDLPLKNKNQLDLLKVLA